MSYEQCLVELDEVMNHLSKENLNKIPKEILEGIKKQKDRNYEWKYDENKKLIDQKLNRKTIAMLSYINMEYLLNDKQKAFMKKMHAINEQKVEEEKRTQYNPNFLHQNKHSNSTTENNVSLIEVKEIMLYKKIVNFVKNIFKRFLK